MWMDIYYRYILLLTDPFSSMRVSEILVDMNDWVLTHFELLSMAADKWVVNAIVSMIACILRALGGHHYFFDNTFGVKYHAGMPF